MEGRTGWSRSLALAAACLATLVLFASQGRARSELEAKMYLSAMGELPLASPSGRRGAGKSSKDAVHHEGSDPVDESLDDSFAEHAHMGSIRLAEDKGESVQELVDKEDHEEDERGASEIQSMTKQLPALPAIVVADKDESEAEDAQEAVEIRAPAKVVLPSLPAKDMKALQESIDEAAHWDGNDLSSRLPQDRSPAEPAPAKFAAPWKDSTLTEAATAPLEKATSAATPAAVVPPRATASKEAPAAPVAASAPASFTAPTQRQQPAAEVTPTEAMARMPTVSPQSLAVAAARKQLAKTEELAARRQAFPAGNKASQLRTRSFWSALGDCRAKGTCKELLGTKLWNVLQTRPGAANMKIIHDQDPDRKAKERRIERDYLSARPVDDAASSTGDTSARRWQKLESMMDGDRPGEKGIGGGVLTPGERQVLVRQRAAGLNKQWARESDMIFSDDSYPLSPSRASHQAPAPQQAAAKASVHKAPSLTVKGLNAELIGKDGDGVQSVLHSLRAEAKRLRGDGEGAERALEEGLANHQGEDEKEGAR